MNHCHCEGKKKRKALGAGFCSAVGKTLGSLEAKDLEGQQELKAAHT